MKVDPLERHQSSADRVLADGDASAIKQLYVDLGEDWWAAHGDDPDGVPVLSLPETQPVVLDALRSSGGVVLDAGCGPNPALSIGLASAPGCTVVALDIGHGAVRLAREQARRHGVAVLGMVGDVEALPFRDGAFDAVACDDTVEHLPDDRSGVSELARVARRGGQVVIATPNRHNITILRRRARDLLGGRRLPVRAYFLSNSHLREYTWSQFERIVRPALRIKTRRGVGWPTRGWKSRLANRLVVRRPFHRFGQMIVLDAEPR